MLVSNFGNIVNDIFKEEHTSKVLPYRPRIELNELDETYELRLMLPGIQKEDISILQEDGILKISGERKNMKSTRKVLITEFAYGKFERAIRLPKNATKDETTASHDNGVLTIVIAKQAIVKPQEIKIK
jgi:HSP20 family protein